MKDNQYSRRNFLRKYLETGSILAGAGFVLGYTSLSAVAKELAKSSSSNQQPPKKQFNLLRKINVMIFQGLVLMKLKSEKNSPM